MTNCCQACVGPCSKLPWSPAPSPSRKGGRTSVASWKELGERGTRSCLPPTPFQGPHQGLRPLFHERPTGPAGSWLTYCLPSPVRRGPGSWRAFAQLGKPFPRYPHGSPPLPQVGAQMPRLTCLTLQPPPSQQGPFWTSFPSSALRPAPLWLLTYCDSLIDYISFWSVTSC